MYMQMHSSIWINVFVELLLTLDYTSGYLDHFDIF